MALNEKNTYLEIRIFEVNAHLGGFERIFGGDFYGKLFPHGLPPIYTCPSIIKFEFET